MTPLAHLLIALTYSAAAVTVASALWRFSAMGPGVSWLTAGLAVLAASQVHVFLLARQERDLLNEGLEDLREANRLLIEEAEEARTKLQVVAQRAESDAAARHASLTEEVRDLEGIVREMGDLMNERLREMRRTAYQAPTPEDSHGRAASLSAVRSALEAGRVDLCLQPIVTLPQRKTYFYECYTRLRDQGGQIIPPTHWLPLAEPEGLVRPIDNLLLFRSVQVVRRLSARERQVSMFCNVSVGSLGDEVFFPQLLEFVRSQSDMIGALIFEIGQHDFENRSLEAARNITRLADFGVRFSIDKMTHLDIDPAELQRAGVRFAKAPGDLLLDQLIPGERLGLSVAPDVRSEDYSALLAKYGIELIADQIEDEGEVVELLELDIPFAQGHLFGPPRPVRADILDEGEDEEEAPRPRPRRGGVAA